MSWNFKKELKRKAIHLLAISFIIIFILISENYGKEIALFTLVFLLICFVEIDYIRIELEKKIPFIGGLWRKKEKHRFGAQVFFLIGAIISLGAFNFKIALAVILMTVFGDMAAALIGQRFGRIWLQKDRALEGILAEFFVDLIIAFLIFGGWVFSFPVWAVIFVTSATATTVETMVRKMDDNLIIPLFSGFNGQLIIWIFRSFGINFL